MAIKENRRTGGRSARVQESIHTAVRALLDERDRADLTVPQIAARAGVTPSTIYRRWGDLSALLADVALERMLPSEPQDTGTLAGDLHAWAEQYLDEMSSELGRTLIRDVVSDLADSYSIIRHKILELIFSPMKKARTFAEAFMVHPAKKKEDEDG